MNKKFLSIFALCSAISLYGMESDDDDGQPTAGIATLEVDPVAKVNAWKALSESRQWNMTLIFWSLLEEYNQKALQNNEVPLTDAKDKDASLGEMNAVVTRACRDLRHNIRDKGAPVPSTECEFQEYLQPCIAWAKEVPNRTINDISDISLTTNDSEDDDEWQELDEQARQELMLDQLKEIGSDSSAEGDDDQDDDMTGEKQTQMILAGIINRRNEASLMAKNTNNQMSESK